MYEALPKIKKLYELSKSELINYLILKIIHKSIRIDMKLQLRRLVNEWLPLIFSIIEDYNPKFHTEIKEVQEYGTNEFFYFHNKKWALRILMRFYQKYLRENFYRGPEK